MNNNKNILFAFKSRMSVAAMINWPFIWLATSDNWTKLNFKVYQYWKNQKLTNNMQVPKLCFCCDRINLAHVSPFILFLDIWNVKEPRFVLIMFIVCDTDSWIARYHVVVHR